MRDGLKPVQRRILWAMHDANLRPDRPFVKCARVVGDVMANYHPHGDSAIYDALVRMGQPFSLTAPLDRQARQLRLARPIRPPRSRYTECRLSPLAMELLAGHRRGHRRLRAQLRRVATSEPVVLPARFPNLLVNGSQGIAVGMATNIPPHNLAEVCNAALKLIDKPDVDARRAHAHREGPRLPDRRPHHGRRRHQGRVPHRPRHDPRARPVTRSRTGKRGSQAIVLTEVPFQTSVDAIAGKLAELVESGKIDGVRDIRNESGQGKTRLVIELRPDANPQIVLNNLFKHTAAQSTFPVNMVALVDGVPRTLNLAGVRCSAGSTTRWSWSRGASQYRLRRRQDRLHIVEGLRQGARHDRRDREGDPRVEGPRRGARPRSMAKPFEFSEIQANHILDMTLGRLTQLGREELDKERKELDADGQGAASASSPSATC